MTRFWDLLEDSVIVQAFVTASLIATVCVLYATHAQVPDGLQQLTVMVVGFWLGSKSQQQIVRLTRMLSEK